MITHSIYGGIGNQLFQLFTVIALSLKSGHRFFFKYRKMIDDQDTPRHTYWNSFFIHLKPYTINMDDDYTASQPDFLSWDKVDVHEPHHEYFEIIPEYIPVANFSDDTVPCVTFEVSSGEASVPCSPLPEPTNLSARIYELHGYFQSYKYFHQEFAQICDMIRVEEQKHKLLERVKTINPIAMHFRLGDYKGLQHIHPIMPFEYYRNSLTFVLDKLGVSNAPITIFCDKDDIAEIRDTIIVRLMSTFPECDFEYVDPTMVEWEHMLLMSMSQCIIMANSTFSMWSALFNTHTNSVICYPWHWFTDLFKRNVKDMFMSHWHKIGYVVRENDGEKYKYKV